MEIPLKISVQCTDGLAGQVKCVMVNPVSQQLTHMVVEERGFPHLKRLVPLELIKNGNSGHIQLSRKHGLSRYDKRRWDFHLL